MATSNTKTKVIRSGKVKEVSRIKVGDVYVGKCWCCHQECKCTLLGNGHERHEPLDEVVRGLLNE